MSHNPELTGEAGAHVQTDDSVLGRSDMVAADQTVPGYKGKAVIIGTRGYPSYYGGFETLVRRLAPYLVENQWDLTVYGRPGAVRDDDPGLDLRVKTKSTRGVESKSLSTLSYGFSASVDSMLADVDVALIMNVANGFWLPMLKARGIRTVVNVDGIEWERAKWGRAARNAFKMGAKMTARYADELVFDAHAIGDYWRQQFGRTGTFIPYGGDPIYQPPENLMFEPGSYALLVARFVPENTIQEFIEAVDLMKYQTVVVVGSSGYGGPFDAELKRLDATRANVHWLGHIKDDSLLFSLWENCGAYFHGHSVGGTNPALVQAMACGAPTIARDTKYNREVLGEAGQFVKPLASDIARSIEALMGDTPTREGMANASRVRAAEHYSWDSVCQSYSDLMEQRS